MSSNEAQTISGTFEELGIWLCGCQGEEWDGVDPGKLADRLYRACPGAKVSIVKHLCTDPRSFRESLASLSLRAMIVATCGDERTQDNLKRLISETGTDCHGVVFINVRHLVGKNGSVPARELRAARRLYALGRRALAYPGTHPEQIALTLPSLNTVVSRRGLFGLARPSYRVIPQVDSKRCVYARGCLFCRDVCPVGALNHDGDRIEVVATRCTGCGDCLVACRFSSIYFPTWTTWELEAEIKGLLEQVTPDNQDYKEKKAVQNKLTKGPLLGNTSGIAFLCRHAFHKISEKYPDVFNKFEPLILPSLGRLEPFLLLLARAHGVRVVIISCPENCDQGSKFSSARNSVNFARYILEKLGFDPAIDWADFDSATSGDMFSGEEKVLNPQLAYFRVPDDSGNSQVRLANLILALAACAGKTDGVFEDKTVPFGLVEVSDNRCTLCGVCTSRCSTGALSYGEKENGVHLLFKHTRCIACGFCVRSCPEKALHLRRGIDFGLLSGQARSLANSELARCTECEVEMAPLILQAQVLKQGDLCPRCRIGQQIRGLR